MGNLLPEPELFKKGAVTVTLYCCSLKCVIEPDGISNISVRCVLGSSSLVLGSSSLVLGSSSLVLGSSSLVLGSSSLVLGSSSLV